MFRKAILKFLKVREFIHQNAQVRVSSYKVSVKSGFNEDSSVFEVIFETSEKWELDDFIDICEAKEIRVETTIVTDLIIRK